MSSFKQYKFNSYKPSEIVVAIKILKQLGYKTSRDFFDLLEAVTYGGICTWDDGYITEGYLYVSDAHEYITLDELNSMVCGANSLSVVLSENNTAALREQYKHLIGVQFNKNIYSFNKFEPRYVHDIIRDKDGDVCVVGQYGVDYKLRDVEFYVSDEHDGTATYNEYVLLVNT